MPRFVNILPKGLKPLYVNPEHVMAIEYDKVGEKEFTKIHLVTDTISTILKIDEVVSLLRTPPRHL